MLVERIERTLSNEKETRDPRHIGISALGKCVRQLAYKRAGTPGRGMDGRARLTLLTGTLVHDKIRRIIRRALRGGRGNRLQGFPKELETSVRIGDQEVKGHIDGLLTLKGKPYLLEVKTMNDRAFREFQRYDVIDYAYLIQILAYMEGMGLKEALVLAINKNTGEISEQLINYDRSKKAWEERKKTLAQFLTEPDPLKVPREYGPKDGETALPWQCAYCPFVDTCWAERGVKEVGRNKFVVTK